ncbi:putative BspA family leucine-rich repeat surface protein [Aeromonas phage ZPAH34]|uniref:putative BspA family leucine-rich repeat surface protein n=1 Tax=Aeromonas phage ZPAH34 TaxID=2924888 RepID=UPI0023299AAF|nr:putative BspA family leucine-rich repeat surface protein [Aeromonas phage ZPAH34]UOX39573.1 putative BspA family leucine-rich repeat surface protein [Aeromonas phage ZPAH34]
MKIDKDKPLVPVERTSPIGVVLDAFIRVDRKIQEKSSGSSDEDRIILDVIVNNTWPRSDGITDPEVPIPAPGEVIEITQEEIIEEVRNVISTKLDEMGASIDEHLLQHTNKVGPVHGETKSTVGLGKKDNWDMATIQQHIDGVAQNLYCNPAGLSAIIDERVKVDPRSYIPARSLPIASGGILGEIPQWHYDFYKGELVQSPSDPKQFIGDTAWYFGTQIGMHIFPNLNQSPELGRYTATPSGTAPEVQTSRGGTKVRAYAKRIDVRRSRPAQLRGWRSPGSLGTVMKVSDNLFGRSAFSYMEGNKVCLRSFNKSVLPFDVLETTGNSIPFEGIFESAEDYLYHFILKINKGSYPGESSSVPYLKLSLTGLKLNPWSMDLQEGPPNRLAEFITKDPIKYQTNQITVPVNSKILAVDTNGTGEVNLVIPFKNLFNIQDEENEEFFNSLDIKRLNKLTFGWEMRIRHKGLMRIYFGWFNKDKTKYWHGYLDFRLDFVFNDATKQMSVNIVTDQVFEQAKQTLDSNWDLTDTGLFKAYTPHVKEQPEHPLCQDGVFDPAGGHLKTFTFYNRQYIGSYDHSISSVTSFIDNGNNYFPKPTKYSYVAQSNIEHDGMYGDHLRHIPVKIALGTATEQERAILDIAMNNRWPRYDGLTDDPVPVPDPGVATKLKITYLTYSRDYRNRYKWGLVTVDAGTSYLQGNPYGSYLGPKTDSVNWITGSMEDIPSFLIENDDLSSTMNINNMVFNDGNGYTNYLNYEVDPNNLETPITFNNPVSIHEDILNWISKNAGGWFKQHKTFFFFKSTLFWMNQCVGHGDYPTNEKDCYYGIIKNCYVHTDGTGRKTIKPQGSIASSIVVNTMNVNKKSTLQINHGAILGYDSFKSQDVYIMKMSDALNQVKYDVMLNVAPFNNFYIELQIVHNPLTGSFTFGPKLDSVDPIFPYDPEHGYQIDYDKEICYGTKLPHRLHINYQSPVMLSKGMWAFRKTPNNYGVFTREHGFLTLTGGVMGTTEGFTLYPVGGVIMVNGKNTLVKKPVKARVEEFFGYDELFVTQIGNELYAYGRYNNPTGYEIEPQLGSVPAGFINGTEFSYQDQSGWRNSLLPVIARKRMNVSSDGSSFPVFLGKPGSGLPINRFFKQTVATRLLWDTSKGRVIPIINRVGGSPYLLVNGTVYQLSGLNSFTIPGSYTGIVTIDIFGVSVLKWGLGLTELLTIGSRVTELDFSNSEGFKITATLSKNIANFNGVFKNSVATSYPGLEFWDVGHVYTMNECFFGASNFNQDLSNWYMNRVATFFNWDNGTTAWTLPKPTFPTYTR